MNVRLALISMRFARLSEAGVHAPRRFRGTGVFMSMVRVPPDMRLGYHRMVTRMNCATSNGIGLE